MRLSCLIFLLSISALLISCQPTELDPPPDPTPVVLKDTTIKDIPYGVDANQKFDFGLPANRTAATQLVIVVHGGGWSAGDKNELTWLLNGLKQRGYAVANINYRLTLSYPDNYKLKLDDVDSAIQNTLRLASVYSFTNQKFYIVGHSAGAHLALCYAYTRNNNGKIKAAASMAGPTDLFSMSYYNGVIYNSLLEPFLGMPLIPTTATSIQRYQSCSPQYQATASSPATIFFHGQLDPVVNPNQSINMAVKLGTLGVDRKNITYPLVFHDWWGDGTKINNTMDELKTWFTNHP